jgi:SAM-dependent methyltransferase
MHREQHWEQVYRTKSPTEVSWYEPHLTTSLAWIVDAAPGMSASIVDVGGGASTLVDDLTERGFRSLTVTDISAAAISHSQQRLGARAGAIRWITGDITHPGLLPAAAFDLWHDRAVFHFLTEPADIASYREQIASALRPAGQAILATFSVQGPTRCSGLPVARYDAASLAAALGERFRLVKSADVPHRTPAGSTQEFLYCLMERV